MMHACLQRGRRAPLQLVVQAADASYAGAGAVRGSAARRGGRCCQRAEQRSCCSRLSRPCQRRQVISLRHAAGMTVLLRLALLKARAVECYTRSRCAMLKDAGARHLQHQAYDNEAARTLERRAQVLQSMQGLSHAHAHTGSVTAALEGREQLFLVLFTTQQARILDIAL